MKRPFPFLMAVLFCQMAFSQSYTHWITGDTADFITQDFLPGLVLSGGGSDNDDAMRWMLERAGGGDVVVLRASGSDGYNNYFFSELGVNVNSVETIRFNNASAATDPYVLQQINHAELVFIAGGDQYNYYQYWKGTPVGDALNFLLNEKKITIGGTSAGMAILGEAYYAPPGGSAQSDVVLADPFHPNVNILGLGDFLQNPLLANLVTDTHYDQRNRAGRHVVFMARLAAEHGTRTFGIACNEYTAVGIDENGVAAVFGEYPDYEDFAYFLQANCQEEFLPEILQPGTPLTWNRNLAAVKACRVPGLVDSGHTFDLNDWMTTTGGEWFDWVVDGGVLIKYPDAQPACDAFITGTENVSADLTTFTISPNPAQDFIRVEMQTAKGAELKICSPVGQILFQKKMTGPTSVVDLKNFTSGLYFVSVEADRKTWVKKLMVHR